MRTKLGFLAILVLVLSLVGCGLNTSPGNGEKIGQIVKISKQGMMRDTWEAQLIRGGMNGGSGSFGTVPFDFTIENDADAEKATQFMQNQTEVVIRLPNGRHLFPFPDGKRRSLPGQHRTSQEVELARAHIDPTTTSRFPWGSSFL